MSLSAREKANLTRWNGHQSPFYEVYYLKGSDPERSIGFWLRYTILAQSGRLPEASVWAMLFDGNDPSKNAAIRRTYSLKDVRIERDFFYVCAGPSAIFDDGCRGDLDDGRQRVTWELTFREKGEPLWYYPGFLYKTALPRTKFVVPHLSTRLAGDLKWNDRHWTFTELPAHQGHLWGVEHAESWTWANANTFREDHNFCFEGLSARVRIGGKPSPALTLLFFLWEGRLYRCNSPRKWFANKSVGDLDRWHFEATSEDLMFVGDCHTHPEHMTAVRYQDPSGGERFSHHTELANVRIQILRKTKAGWTAVKTLTAERSAAFEVVRRDHDPRVRLLLP